MTRQVWVALSVLAATALFASSARSGAALEPPLRMPLSTAKATHPEGQEFPRLICSDDSREIVVDGTQFPASALGSGVLDQTACRWFGGEAIPAETTGTLAGVATKQILSFVAPATGDPPLLYDVLATGNPADFDTVLDVMTAAFGPGEQTASPGAVGPRLQWRLPNLSASIARQDRDTGLLTIEYTDEGLEAVALGIGSPQ